MNSHKLNLFFWLFQNILKIKNLISLIIYYNIYKKKLKNKAYFRIEYKIIETLLKKKFSKNKSESEKPKCKHYLMKVGITMKN